MPDKTPVVPAKVDPGLSLEEMKTFVQNHFEDFVNRKKSDVALINFSEDFLDHDEPDGVAVGAQAAKTMMEEAYQKWPDLHVTVEDILAEGDKVMVRNVWRATSQATGQKIEFHGFVLWRFANKKIVERWATITPPKPVSNADNKMNITLFGATGNAGARILKELLARGHQVTAIVRDPTKLPPRPGLTVRKGDLSDENQIAEAVEGREAVISAYGPGLNSPGDLVGATERLVNGLKQAGVQRLLMVGGAGSLEVSPGVQLVDSGYLPEEWKPIALAHRVALQILRTSGLDWTSLCPAAYFEPGLRTGAFRLGKDNLVANEKGESRISMEDYAIALVNELESHAHPRQRFSVGY